MKEFGIAKEKQNWIYLTMVFTQSLHHPKKNSLLIWRSLISDDKLMLKYIYVWDHIPVNFSVNKVSLG